MKNNNEKSPAAVAGQQPFQNERRFVELGAFVAPLKEQLTGLKDADFCQRKADAISFLLLHGLITDRESDRARRRLIKSFRFEQGEGQLAAAGNK